MMYQCGRCGLTRVSGQEMGVIAQCKCPWEFVPLVAPQRTWVGLTGEETETLIHRFDGDPHTLLDEVNARLKEKNND